jgi:predicted glycosyltransferase
MKRAFGYFVHHQGRGHAERCAALANALPGDRPLTIFCARDDIFPPLPASAVIIVIPSLFEKRGDEAAAMDHVPTPATLHCAPLGWPSIRRAMAAIVAWFDTADPALMICDVSAEVAQLSRICSVPHVKVLQHGDRSDAGHQAAYDGAVGLLAPFHADLAQSEWSPALKAKTCFAGGLGVDRFAIDREAARKRINVAKGEELILVMAGGGGSGFGQAPLSLGARSRSAARWITIGPVERDWHATEPSNIEHRGWVDNAADYIAAADLVISSTGNTTCQQILDAARPWLAIPEWRYFDEQHRKASALAAIGAACVLPHLPSSAGAWDTALSQTYARHQPALQAALIEEASAEKASLWLESLAARCWPAAAPSFAVCERND